MLIRWLIRFSPVFILWCLLSGPVPAVAVTPPLPARPPGHVVDLAGVLPPEQEGGLEKLLVDLEHKTTAQMVVLTILSLDGEPLNEFSLQTAQNWGIGQKGKDNGLLFLISLHDRKYRFEVGYGLEPVLPDSLLGTLGRRVLVPLFRQGRYGDGITAASAEIIRILGKHYGVDIKGTESLRPLRRQQTVQGSALAFFLFLLFVVLIIYSSYFNRKTGGRRGYGPGGPYIFPGGGWGGGGSGGFGGFSGGGGSFGGGGASGGW
jgi:uncharacterized protein